MKRIYYVVIAVALLDWMASGAAVGEITPFTPQGPYPSNGVQANSLDFSMMAIGETMSATFPCTGKELLLVHNAAISSATFNIVSITDEFGAKGDIGGTVASGSTCVFWFGARKGWDSGSGVQIISGTSGLLLSVARLNQVFKPVGSATTSSRFTVSNVRGTYPSSEQVTAGQLELVQNAAGFIAMGTFPVSGREVVIWHNTDTVETHNFILVGYPNKNSRTLSMPNVGEYYALGSGEWACWVLSSIDSWANPNGHCLQSCDNAAIKIGIAKLPIQ